MQSASLRRARGAPAGTSDGALAAAGGARLSVACFPPIIQANPYQRLLYDALAARGIQLVPSAKLRVRWLWRSRSRVDVLHFHWPEAFYRDRRPRRLLRLAASWLKVGALAVRLAAARLLRYRIVWTVHQVSPHESSGRRLDRAAAVVLATASDALVVHDDSTASLVENELGRRARARCAIIPMGSYIDVYAAGRPREVVRRELGIPGTALVFLCFGHVRAYKDVDLLVDAFRRAALPDACLVVAGLSFDEQAAGQIVRIADEDRRIKPLLEFVPDEAVEELFRAADVAVIPRGDGGTSASIVLALSLGLPVVAANRPTYAALLDDERAGWLFEPYNVESLSAVLETAAADPPAIMRKAELARSRAGTMRWEDTAAATAAVFTKGAAA